MRISRKLKLSKRTELKFAIPLDDERLNYAADELGSLLYARFGENKSEVIEEVSVDFLLNANTRGFSVKVKSGGLIFTAPDTLQLLYAVYDFAEEYLGFCFFEPGVDTLTEFGGTVSFDVGKDLIKNRQPALEIRGFVQEFPFSEDSYAIADWMVKNKLNYIQTWMCYYDDVDDDLKAYHKLRGITIESGHHNFSYLIPTEKYAAEHPEFFAEINGQRIKPSADKNALLLSEQLCTTNPELREELVKRLMEYSSQHPEITHLGLNPNDGFGWCECPECSKFYDKNHKGELYSLSEHVYLAGRIYHDLLKYVNRRLRENNCNLNVSFGAYINYCAPTEDFQLTDGLSVSFAPYWHCINHRIDDPVCPVNSRYAEDIRAWCNVKAGGKVVIYEYLMGVNLYLSLPMIHHNWIFDEVKFYKSIGVDGFITQFHLPHWNVYGTNYYAMAQALYGKSRLTSMKRMWKALFNNDADGGKRFYDNLRKVQLSAGKCHIPYPYSLFSRTNMVDYEKLHKAALKLSRKLPNDCFRKNLVIWTEYLCRFKKFFDDYHAGNITLKEAQDFQKWVHKSCNGRNIVVMPKFDMYLRQIQDSITAGKQWIHFGIDWEDDYILKHHSGILS